MNVCLDSDVCMDHLNGRSAFMERLVTNIERGEDRAFASVIVEAELLAGCRTAAQQDSVDTLLGLFTVLPAGREEAALAGRIRLRFGPQGLLLPDAFIAATALLASLPLVTRNARHFRNIPGLELIAPELAP